MKVLEKMHNLTYEISFRLRHPSLDFLPLCERFGLEPFQLYVAGNPRHTKSGDILDGYYSESYCSFRLNKIESMTIPQRIAEFTANLANHRAMLEQITSTGGTLNFFIGWFSDGNSGEEFDWDLLQKLADLKISLHFDVYC
jgi:hypothetical protein